MFNKKILILGGNGMLGKDMVNAFIKNGFKNSEENYNGENSLIGSRSKVDLNNLIKKVKDEEKRSKRQNIVISAAALSAVAVFGIILTL